MSYSNDINRYSSALISILILLIIILIILLSFPEFLQIHWNVLSNISFFSRLKLNSLYFLIFPKNSILLSFNVALSKVHTYNGLLGPWINHAISMRKSIFPISFINKVSDKIIPIVKILSSIFLYNSFEKLIIIWVIFENLVGVLIIKFLFACLWALSSIILIILIIISIFIPLLFLSFFSHSSDCGGR